MLARGLRTVLYHGKNTPAMTPSCPTAGTGSQRWQQGEYSAMYVRSAINFDGSGKVLMSRKCTRITWQQGDILFPQNMKQKSNEVIHLIFSFNRMKRSNSI